jgi:hypothetical protein
MSKLKSALPALIVVVAILGRLIPGPRTIDDAFITFRYARSILAGQGFVYNPGEAILGTTTPLYTLLMAGLGALTGGVQAPFPQLAMLVNALADAATCLMLWRLGRRLGFERAGLAAALAWAVAPFSVTFAIGGLETSLYVAFLTGAFTAALFAHSSTEFNPVFAGTSVPAKTGLNKYRLLAALLASLALLTRPDALILLGPLALERLWSAWKRKESIHPAELAAALLPYGAWAIYAGLVFGSPLPHSILAKAAAYRLDSGEALIRLIQHYATPFLEQDLLGAPLAVGLGLLLYPLLTFLGARAVLKSRPRPPLVVWAWLLYPWLYLLTFALPNPLIFRWYLTPPLPAYFFFIFIGLEFLLLRLAARKKTTQSHPNLARWADLILIIPILFSLADWRLAPDNGPAAPLISSGENIALTAHAPAPDMAFVQLEQLYRQAAARIAPQLTPRSTLAAGDVGVLGYFTPARILDTVGLNSAISTSYYPLPAEQYVINYAIPTALILDQQPDWIVILEVYARRTFLPDPRFQSAYRLIEKIPTTLYSSDGLLIFQRINH